MSNATRTVGLLLLAVLLASPTAAQEVPKAVANWGAPLLWSPAAVNGPRREAGQPGPVGGRPESAHALTAVSPASVPTAPLPLIGITPCRIANTTGNGGFTGAYGPPALSQGVARDFILTGQCGIPASASAVSLNVTVTNTTGPGFIKIFPAGGSTPAVSTLNYVAGQVVANAAVVPLGTGGAITVIAGVSGADLILDTNGYYDNIGIITQVSPGTGLSGGGTSGNVTLDVNFGGTGVAATASRSDHTHSTADLVSGLLASARLGGTYSNALTLSSPLNILSGNGAGLLNVNAVKLQGLPASAFQPRYVRTVVVSPVGTATDNGTALLAALAGITTASATNPWLLKIEPGIYDLGDNSIFMQPFVDIEGSGELVTLIQTATSVAASGANNAEMRLLTLQNLGGVASVNGFSNASASPRLTHIAILVSGGSISNYGVHNSGASSPLLTDVTVSVTGTAGANSWGIDNASSSPDLRRVRVAVDAAGGAFSYGIANAGGSPTIQDAVVSAFGGSANFALVSGGGSSPKLVHVTATGDGGSDGWGMYVVDATAEIIDSILVGNRGSSSSRGIVCAATATTPITIRNTRVAGGDLSLSVGSAYTVRVGASELDGPVLAAVGATLACVGAFDANYAALNTTCN